MNLIGVFHSGSLAYPGESLAKALAEANHAQPTPPPPAWTGRCANEGEDVPMKGKMRGKIRPWRGRCANEGEDVAIRCGNSRFQKVEIKSVRESISRKQTSRVSARRHPSTKNAPRVSLRTGCPPVYRAVTTKKTRLKCAFVTSFGFFPILYQNFMLYMLFSNRW